MFCSEVNTALLFVVGNNFLVFRLKILYFLTIGRVINTYLRNIVTFKISIPYVKELSLILKII